MSDVIATMEPIRKRPITAEAAILPAIVNLVSTVILLPQGKGYKLPLHAIARALPSSQYAPVLFAANILKIKDSLGEATPLVFASGKIVVVSGQTPHHTLYVSQLTRFVIEQIECAMLGEDGVVNPRGSLMGRTIFEHCTIHNIVGHANLGCRISLQAIMEAAPSACKWVPDLFPGLKCQMWLTESGHCECKLPKCVCAMKVLIFDSGRIVITGGRSVRDVNSIFFRIRAIAPQFASGDAGVVIPREDRFYQRLSTMLVPSGATMKDMEIVAPGEMDEDEALATLFEEQASLIDNKDAEYPPLIDVGNPAAAAAAPIPDQETPLMVMAQAGRVQEVKFLLACQPNCTAAKDANGRTTLQRMRLIPASQRTAEQQEVIELLMGHI